MTSTRRPLRNPDRLPRIPPVQGTASEQPARSVPPARARLEECVPAAWALAGAVGWLLLLGIALAIQPQPSDPAAVPSPVDALLTTVLAVTISGAILGLAIRRRAGFAASLAGAGALLAAVLLCPVTGHHEIGSWWYGQLACVGGLIALSTAGLLGAPGVDE